MPRMKAKEHEDITLQEKYDNAVESAKNLQRFLPIPVYASLGTRFAARALITSIQACRPAQKTSAVLAFQFEYNTTTGASPCAIG